MQCWTAVLSFLCCTTSFAEKACHSKPLVAGDFVSLEDERSEMSQWDRPGVYLLQTSASRDNFENAILQPDWADVWDQAIISIHGKANYTGADLVGVTANQAGDLAAFLAALKTHVSICIFCYAIFLWLRKKYPAMYANNSELYDKLRQGRLKLGDSIFSPIEKSWRVTTDDVVEIAGLDHGLLVEFSNLGMQIMLFIGIPAMTILVPLYSFLGGGAAGADELSWWGFANVTSDNGICWVVAFFVWYVVVGVQFLIFRAHEKEFVIRRKTWLLQMPVPRSCTVLAENIPDGKNSEDQIESFFNGIFGYDAVKEVAIVKDTSKLLAAMKVRDTFNQELHEAEFKWEAQGHVDEDKKADLTSKVKTCEEEVELIRKETIEDKSLKSNSAFITFNDQKHCIIAQSMRYGEDDEEFVLSVPPDPSDVLYQDLQVDWRAEAGRESLGYCLIAALFFGFIPIVGTLSALVSEQSMKQNFPFTAPWFEHNTTFASLWVGLMGSFGLTFFMSFLPTFLVMIFSGFFALRAEAWRQHRIQQWYFYFLVLFVLLVTAVGDSLFMQARNLAEHPFEIFQILAKTLPSATHFYLNYVCMQWGAHAMNMLRYINLAKFFAFKQVCSIERSRSMAEPEDQDYYGMGSRSARHTLILTVGLVFCTLTPLMTIVVFVNCFLTRAFYSYLMVYAETKKPDLGGMFWVTQLRHVQQGLVIYILLMTGVLLQRAESDFPAIIAASSFFFWLPTYIRFVHKFRIESLPLKDLNAAEEGTVKLRRATRDTYVQPELLPQEVTHQLAQPHDTDAANA